MADGRRICLITARLPFGGRLTALTLIVTCLPADALPFSWASLAAAGGGGGRPG